MFQKDIIGSILVLTAFIVEFLLKVLHKNDRKFLKDTMANFSLGLTTLFVGAFEKIFALGLYSFIDRKSTRLNSSHNA